MILLIGSVPSAPELTQSKRSTYVRFSVSDTGHGIAPDLRERLFTAFDRLDEAALSAVRSSTCKPYLENGVPIRAAYTQPYQFGLND